MTPHAAKILVIEDDDAVRLTLRDLLELNGYTVVTAANGDDGLIEALHQRPDLIVTDLAMPGKSGYELLDSFRHDPELRSVPVIVVTAKIERADMRRGMELGAADFITKPFTEAEMIRSVTARLEKKELMDELDAFAHTVAHDLRNPLSILHGRLYLAAQALGQGATETAQRNLDEATTAADRLNRIIEEILLLSGVRRMTLRPEPLAMAALVAEALAEAGPVLRQYPATVRVAETWPEAAGHGPWVVHLWVNYLTNAAKYAGPNADIELGGEARPGTGRARFWVRDRGPGLAAEACAGLFVPFARISTVRAKGHGLGLSIVRRIAEKLGGSAGVESAPGAGATFWFELPERPPAPAAVPPVLP